MKTVKTAILACALLISVVSQAMTVRATELKGSVWKDLMSGVIDSITVEFRQGDVLPVNVSAEGDLVETTQSATSYITVKRNFWLRAERSNIQISLDGTQFKSLGEVLTGKLEATAGSDQAGGIANTINILFSAFLK